MRLYKGPVDPSNWDTNLVAAFNVSTTNSMQTQDPYGPGYFVAYWTRDYRSNKSVLIAKAGPTG